MYKGATKEEKQNYLLSQIINQGYDGDQFVEYIKNLKENGEDIDSWTIEELMQIVQNFKIKQENDEYDNEYEHESHNEDHQNNLPPVRKSILDQKRDEIQEQTKEHLKMPRNSYQQQNHDEQNKQQLNQQDEKKENQQQHVIQKSSNNTSKRSSTNSSVNKDTIGFEIIEEPYKESTQQIFMEKYGIMEDYMNKQIKCVQLKPKIEIADKIKVLVSNPKENAGYFFGLTGKTITYEVITKPYDWKVIRKLSDFTALRNMLLKVFPGKIIPPTDYNTRENSPYELQKRMKFMNSFSNTLVEDKTLFYNPFTISFFGDDTKKWENTIKIMEKQGPKDKIKYNFEGQYPLKFSNEMYEYKEKLRNFLPKMEGNFNKLYLVSKQLQKDFENVQNTLNQISTCYKSLFEDINQFSGEIIEGQMNHKKLGDSYYINHQIFDGWAQYMQKTKHDIQSFTNLFKFSFEESKVYKDLVKSTEDSEKTFIQYLKLYQSDQQNYKKQHVSNKQKQDDQQYYLSLKHDMAYWLSYTYYEIQDKFQKKGEDNLRFISIFFKSQAQKINEFMQQWANDAQQYVNNPFPIPRDSLQKTQLFKHLQKQNSMKE